jgi:1-deoxy-D-xylulose-5-phosphate synthase
MTVLCPSSYQELPVMFRTALELESGPALLRWPKGAAPQVDPDDVGTGLSARKLRTGDGTVAILALGRMTTAARSAASLLIEQDIDATVWDIRVAKPLDPVMLRDAAVHRLVVTVEDGVAQGGVGDAIALDLASRRDPAPRTVVLGTPDEYIPHGDPDELLADLGLDAVGIAARTVKAVRDLV